MFIQDLVAFRKSAETSSCSSDQGHTGSEVQQAMVAMG